MSDCELKKCKSGLPGTERSNENIGDGCFAIMICTECKELFPFTDLPYPSIVDAVFKGKYRG